MTQKKPGRKGRTPRPDIRLDTGPDMNATDDGETGATIFDNIRDDAYCIVWWVDPAGKARLQFKAAPHMLSEEYIQSLCGGGEFIIREKVPDESGRLEWGRQRRITIDGPHKVLTEIPQYVPRTKPGLHPPAPGAPSGAAAASVGINEVMTAGILNLFKHQQDANAAMLEAMKPKGMGMLEVITLLSPLLEKAIDAFGKKGNGEERKPMADIKEIAETMKTLKEAAGQPSSPAHDYLDLIQKVFKVKKALHLDDDDDKAPESTESPTDRVLEKLAGPLVSYLERSSAPQQPRLPGAKQPERKELATGAVEDMFIATQKKRLLGLAQRNKDASALAIGDYQGLPETYMGPLKAWLAKEECFPDLMKKVPEFAQYQDWFAEYFETMYNEFFPPPEGADGDDDEEDADDEGATDGAAPASQPSGSDAGAAGEGAAAGG